MHKGWFEAMVAAALLVAPEALAGGRGNFAANPAPEEQPPASTAQADLTPEQALDAYPLRLSDRPLAIGKGIGEADIEGSYLFDSNLGFQELPNLRYGLTDKLEVVLLGVRYILSEDAKYLPGLAVRVQLHDFDWQQEPNGVDPYPLLRPGLVLDLRDRFPFHLMAEAHFGYVVSFVAGNYLHGGGPIPTGSQESQELVPMSVVLDYSPLDRLSLKATLGYIYDVLSLPLAGPDQTETLARLDVVWTASHRFDLRVFGQGNWFQDGPLGFVPQVGVGFAYRL